ncbi:hypothetical protein GTP58_03785 [Duganella sp. CY15W]|uniref:hypothetical protein n=1 Tax=Duganella sp. CY15W TaxID=2692172 RepID=UPI001370EB34|nr:hypothetical protein [Duganella sp. CY15W]MYM27437.1 hypothetical protein [Duganella sp. CY15W]
MSIDNIEARLIANALYEIRLLLSPYLGSENDAPRDVRLAAHLAYALHSEAAALIDSGKFDLEAALRKVAAIDNMVPGNDGGRLAAAWTIQNGTAHSG